MAVCAWSKSRFVRPDGPRRQRRPVAASAATRSSNSSAGTTSETRPHASASSASSRRFELIHSKARANPSSRYRNQLPPESGTSPMPTKPGTKVAALDATRTSQATASERPAPAAGPFTAAMTGFSRPRISRMVGW